jgi:hypothetical protein
MSKEAVTGRLREAGRLSDERGFIRKGVDLSPAALASRLRMQGTLSDACRRLVAAGRTLR